MSLVCPSCGSKEYKLNGHIHNGKQNHLCKRGGRQFVTEPSKKYISAPDKEKINKLLLERISLAGIARVMEVRESWLLGYVSQLYATQPADLHAQLPTAEEMQAYLAERFDELVYELLPLKKPLLRLKQHYYPQVKSPLPLL